MNTIAWIGCLLIAGSSCQSDTPAFAKDPPSLAARNSEQTALEGKAIRIIDGDTFDLLLDNQSRVRIRLYGTDSPERGQAFYQAAKDYLGALLQDKRLSVRFQKKDSYGRSVGVVTAYNININERMIRAGMAWHYTRYDQNPAWKALQKAAAAEKAGLWSDPHPTAPWTWKAALRKQQAD